MNFDRFTTDALRNPHTRTIFHHWPTLALPDGWLVAGCLFQTVWNLRSGAAPDAQIKDYDLFYFDDSDLSEAAEAAVQRRVDALLQPLGIVAEATNQARVHLWYESHFGFPYPRLASARDGIDRFLIPATCVGMRPACALSRPADVHDGWEVYAPHDLALLYDGILTSNPLTDHRPLFRAKAASYQRRWPWLTVRESFLS